MRIDTNSASSATSTLQSISYDGNIAATTPGAATSLEEQGVEVIQLGLTEKTDMVQAFKGTPASTPRLSETPIYQRQ